MQQRPVLLCKKCAVFAYDLLEVSALRPLFCYDRRLQRVAAINTTTLNVIATGHVVILTIHPTGRFHGGMFTNYAAMGGRMGNGLSRGMKWSVRITNFTIASFGAAIQSIATGLNSADAILNAIITGRPERLPPQYQNLIRGAPTMQEEDKLRKFWLVAGVFGVLLVGFGLATFIHKRVAGAKSNSSTQDNKSV